VSTTKYLSQIADAFENKAGVTTSANRNRAGYWKRIAAAAEALAGTSSSASTTPTGYMLRAAVAVDSLTGFDGSSYNNNEEGYLARMAAGLESVQSPVSGSAQKRVLDLITSFVVLEPIAVSDFKNATYSIGGISKTYAEMWAAPLIWGDNSISVVANVGLINSYIGATTSASATVNAQAELANAIVAPDVGHSGVMSVAIEQGDSSLAMIQLRALSGAPALIAGLGSPENGAYVKRNATLSAIAGGADFNGGLNKIAYTMTPTSVSLSLNGGAVVTLPTAPADYTAFNLLRLYFANYNAPVAGSSSTIERIDFYAPQDDTALPGLSL
jgi:hypothetical protein